MTTSQKTKCLHCGDISKEGDLFCCSGCKTVYQILNNNHLDQFYTIKKAVSSKVTPQPVTPTSNSYDYLDSAETLKKYSFNNELRISFYVEGIHCHACIWLIEKLPQLVLGIESAQVNILHNTVVLTRKPNGSFAEAARQMDTLGYKLHLQEDQAKQKTKKSNIKSSLTRIGVAAACSANIMIFSISIYAGLEGPLKIVFEWLSAGLMIPILAYSSIPFFQSAWSALKLRTMSIDVPIALALVFGNGVSLSNLFKGSGSIYFDSLSMFVFLVLSVRHLFLSSYQRLDLQSALTSTIIPYEAVKMVQGKNVSIPTSALAKGDLIYVKTGGIIPVDGTIQKTGYVDVQILTGESRPIKKTPGDDILAGMKNVGCDIEVSVQKTGESTRLGALISQINDFEKPKIVLLADKIAHKFLWITIALSSVIFLVHTMWLNDMDRGLQSALALIVLACPCALALATPLAYALSINSAAKAGVCIQSSTALELLRQIKTVFFDKTGTITKGNLEVFKHVALTETSNCFDILYALEKESKHPIASAIKRYILEKKENITPIYLESFQEISGKGVSGMVNGDVYEVTGTKNYTSEIVTSIGLFKNQKMIAEFFLSDSVKDEAKMVVEQLIKQNYEVKLISGDQNACVKVVGDKVGILDSYGQLTPEDKANMVQQTPCSLMIGDGANDTQAMVNATVSIAVQGSFESSLKVADIYLVSNSLKNIIDLFKLSKKTNTVIIHNFVFALTYNAVGIGLVILGKIHPLIAAVLMPLSSITVIGYSWLRLKKV